MGKFFLQWHITSKCNLKCSHCYSTDFSNSIIEKEKVDYVLEQFDRLLKYIKREGRIQFTGGEPFLSDLIFYAIKEARKKNMEVRVLSNGTLIDEKIVEKLKNSGCYIVQISIEGNKKINDKIRGKDSYKRALKGAEVLKNNGIEVTFAMTLTKINSKNVEDLFKITSKYGIRVGFHRLVPIGCGKDLKEYVLTKEELFNLYLQIIRLKNKYKNIIVPLRDPLYSILKPSCKLKRTIGCSAGFSGICIESNGDVFPCRRLPIKIGNVYQESLIEIFNHQVMQDLRDRNKRNGRCRECNIRWHCGGCPAVSYSITGNYLDSDPQCFQDLVPQSSFLKNFIL